MSNAMLRRFLWRLGRKLYLIARRDVANVPAENGEYWLVEQVAARYRGASAAVLLDVGANKGEWTLKAVSVFRSASKEVRVHAFEPTGSTHGYLMSRLQSIDAATVHNVALSDCTEKRTIYVVGDLAGTNSLYLSPDSKPEQIDAVSLDDFLSRTPVDRVTMVKCDTEGHDFSVLLGAEATLSAARVDLWQFEYNHRWLAARRSLRDVFEFIANKPYRLGKLFGFGVEFYDVWNPELDKFYEANYVLIRKGSPWEGIGESVHFDASNVLVPT